MKRFLQFSGLIAAVIAIVGFVLMMTCPSLVYTVTSPLSGSKSSTSYSGIMGIFGGTVKGSIGGISFDAGKINPTPLAIVAFVLLCVAIVILLLGAILPIMKVKALNKFSGLLNLIAVVCLIAAGVMLFFEVPSWCAAQSTENYKMSTDNFSLGAGWIIAAVLSIVGGVVAILPACANFLAKGKKRR